MIVVIMLKYFQIILRCKGDKDHRPMTENSKNSLRTKSWCVNSWAALTIRHWR